MRFLVIDDNPDHRELAIARVRKAYPEAHFEEIIRESMLEEALRNPDLDMVLTDYRIQWTDGLKVLALVKAKFPLVPVIMVTDTGSEEIAAAGMKGGLDDYVLKGHLHRLVLAVRESLEKSRLRREHDRALEQLRISEERYRTVSELSSDYAYCYRVDDGGVVELEWITQAFTRITGWTAAELEQGVLLPLVHPSDRAAIERGRDVLFSGKPYAAEIRIVTKDGQVRWLRDSARPEWNHTAGRVVRIYGAGQDITERKRADEERAQLIREQAARAEAEAGERRYRSLAEAIPQLVWTSRSDGTIDYCNRRFFEYSGLDEPQTYRQDGWTSILHSDDRATTRERWTHALQTGEAFEVECRFRRASDGSYRWHLCRAVPLRDPQDGIVKWLGTCTDIEDQKRSGEDLREAQKLESIGLLAGGVAHDFNNLLTGILGNASLVLEELSADSRLRPMMESVVLASERAADLTRQLLAYAGKGRFFVQPTDVSQLVRAISSLIQSSIPKKVDLRLELDPNLPMVEADPAQIQQLVMNLVINGAEAIGEERSGTVTVSTLLDPSGESVVIQVDDDGCGMDESVRSRIFDPFFTTKFTGRGLGLAAALGIVRGHHGEIRIDSAPGIGTLFEVRLPAKGARVPQVKEPPKQRELRGAGEVLVIDDEELVRQMAQSTLERYGYTVTLASDGREGVELFRARAGKISLVLLDMMMPVMGGDEALEEIRAISRNVPVIGSSGYSEVTAKERFGQRGLAAFLQKPYSSQELADCVKSVIESRVILGGAAG